MKRDSLKSPNDYPLLGYRVKPEIREELKSLLEETWVNLNNGLTEDQKDFSKNEIFVKALRHGLKHIQRQSKR